MGPRARDSLLTLTTRKNWMKVEVDSASDARGLTLIPRPHPLGQSHDDDDTSVDTALNVKF